MKIILFSVFLIVMIGNIYMNYRVYKIEKEVDKKIKENIAELKERKTSCTEINCNIERAIDKIENVENITIEELTEKVAEKLKSELQKSYE